MPEHGTPAAIAIRNARYLEELHRQKEELRQSQLASLNEICLAIAHELGREETLRQILTVGKQLEVLTGKHGGHMAITPEEAVATIKNRAGDLFDPAVVDALERALHSGALARVLTEKEEQDRTEILSGRWTA